MTVSSPPPSATKLGHDPYELDRLAQELAAREAGQSRKPADDTFDEHSSVPDLPTFVPLSQQHEFLAADKYDVDGFLLSRFQFASLTDLRSELRDFLAELKESLVKLINDDYEAFISLSTDLKGEGARMDRLKRPLDDLKGQVLLSRGELQVLQETIEQALEKRSRIREEKAFLRQLVKISDSVTRLENLLLISNPDEATASPTKGLSGSSYPDPSAEELKGDRGRNGRAKHLGRVAAEYVQLLYHVSKAQQERSAFVDEIQWRVDRINSTLSSDLDHFFATTVTALVDNRDDKNRKISDADKARYQADVEECLRTYDVLGLWRDAEDVLRRDVVRGFVKKTIFPAALSVPLSPIVPVTPFQARIPQSSIPPRTPYTPFTAFASKQNPFEATFGTASSSTLPGVSNAHLLDDSEDPLAALYNTILRFVDRDLKRIMEAAEKVSLKSGARPKLNGMLPVLSQSVALKSQDNVFEIMANVVWAEIGRAIMDELGSTVFSVGNADVFRKHYETTQAFVRALEFLAPSAQAIEAMRSHSVYSAFQRRWQLPAYLAIRRRAIIGPLEDVLSAPAKELPPKRVDNQMFWTPQASAVWNAMHTCWSGEVYIPELSAGFWKLTLQLLSRYKSWLDGNLPAPEPSSKTVVAAGQEKNQPLASPGIGRPATPKVGEAGSETTVTDKARLTDFAAAITDIRTLNSQVINLWQQEISVMLPDTSHSDESNALATLEGVLLRALSNLKSLVPPMIGQITTVLSKQACDAVAAVKSIPAQVRMSQNKRPPSEPSAFVSTVLRPVSAFFAPDGTGAALRDDLLATVALEVFENAADRYAYYISSWRKTEESLRRLQRGQRSTFSLFSSGKPSAEDARARDDERIRTQMILDVEAFGQDGRRLGVDIDNSGGYKTLHEMVQASISHALPGEAS